MNALRRVLLSLAALAAVALAFPRLAARAQPPASPPPAAAPAPDAAPLPPEEDAKVAEVVKQQCTRCHVQPPPEYVPRGMWRFRIQEMAERSMTGTGVPKGEESLLWQQDLDAIIRYFESHAPRVLPLPPLWPDDDGGLKYRRHVLNPPGHAPLPVVSNVRFLDLDGDGKLEIVACDMGRGSVFIGDPRKPEEGLRQVAILANPAHAEMVDLDRDGKQDLLVADLGEYLPSDHEKGSVVWLRQTGPLQFETRPLLEHLPRNADAQAADFDGDGDLDIVVASYGFRKVGGTLLFENETTDWAQPTFTEYPLDARPGPIHVPVADLNGDKRPDFVALVAQQYEHVVAFLNRGPGRGFRQETIFRAVTPVWGSSGIQLVDLDKDGDLDVLMTNGDTLDDFTIRPFHGVRWLENRGEYPFVPHDLVAMPGVHRAQAIDVDGDGDLDVFACAFLPSSQNPQFQNLERQGNLGDLASVGWLEQTAPGQFKPHALEKGRLTHVTLDLADYDGDGDLDLLVGNFAGFTFAKADTGYNASSWVEVWENLAKSPAAPR
ncbi:MAG: VCBS repeat-containing protein [Vicinamibacteria bacterium]